MVIWTAVYAYGRHCVHVCSWCYWRWSERKIFLGHGNTFYTWLISRTFEQHVNITAKMKHRLCRPVYRQTHGYMWNYDECILSLIIMKWSNRHCYTVSCASTIKSNLFITHVLLDCTNKHTLHMHIPVTIQNIIAHCWRWQCKYAERRVLINSNKTSIKLTVE